MGRPPIGKRAMTDAERHRRYIARLTAAARQAQAQDSAGLRQENTALRQKVAVLEQELARQRAIAKPRQQEGLGMKALKAATTKPNGGVIGWHDENFEFHEALCPPPHPLSNSILSRGGAAGNREDVGKPVSQQRRPREAETARDRRQNALPGVGKIGKTAARQARDRGNHSQARDRGNHSIGHRGAGNVSAAAAAPAIKTARRLAKMATAPRHALDKSPAPDEGIQLRSGGHRFAICAHHIARSASRNNRRTVAASLAGRSRDEYHGRDDQFSSSSGRLPHIDRRRISIGC